MRSFPRLSAVILVVLFPGIPRVLSAQEPASYYVVPEYDVTRDPAVDLAMAEERAQAEGKRILLEVGGEWCGWCKTLDEFIREHPPVSNLLASGFLVIKVNWSRENQNQPFLSQYPEIRGFPHIFVLDKNGTFLHSQDTAELEEGRSYDESALVHFLEDWMLEGG